MSATENLRKLRSTLAAGVLGQEELVDGLLVGLLAGGHVLVEGVPGLAKTRAVHLLADACGLDFQRLQFTPDLLPADVVGTRIFDPHQGRFEVVRGPVFAHFVLADEINRAPAKVQSALLETMQERQVTIGRETHPLPAPFHVFATQNPIEQEGTYPLPEAQLDRFLLKLVVDYPRRDLEPDIVRLVLEEGRHPKPAPILDPDAVLDLQRAARGVFVEDRIVRYATEIVHATRSPEDFGLALASAIDVGASPRASIGLVLAARATALLHGRKSVRPEDVKDVAHSVLRHRIVRTYTAIAEGVPTDDLIDRILERVDVP